MSDDKVFQERQLSHFSALIHTFILFMKEWIYFDKIVDILIKTQTSFNTYTLKEVSEHNQFTGFRVL
ncbi:hypothetical protein HanHA300_Chr15g0554481 [Helianthus annuus]|nr:hypothetical protein HanHA300_Chr15g0554481 [Helianthus annuus]